ncbi:hypothetical protein ULMS_02850 [Patiriisocius marinistellae]|uniref:Secretion system C-terminal sorting domain-containing protein n=2 Tax=Patiriisocius marinistellae TaxID=2494560 RepID=A0A5J4FS94_9FLAO|nr:hypothetical protein ULMS_02850 [Patiriisocius marinistellae]
MSTSQIISAQNAELFQTWYLYSITAEFGDTNYYYGNDVAQMSIHEDFSFNATDNCWELMGNFEFISTNGEEEFGLKNLNYEKACVLGGNSGYNLELIYEYENDLTCYIYEGNTNSDLFINLDFFLTYHFKNETTLNMPESNLQNITIFPNPTSQILNIGNLSAPIENAYLYAMNGTLVKSFSNFSNQLTISEVNTGVYFLVIEQGGATTVKRIVKQ